MCVRSDVLQGAGEGVTGVEVVVGGVLRLFNLNVVANAAPVWGVWV